MEITITLSTPLSDGDREILAALAGQTVSVELAETEPENPARAPRKSTAPKATEPEDDAKPAPAKKAAAKKAPAKPADDGDDDLMSQAVSRATELVSSGQAPKVKAALATVGAKRVSELTAKTLPDFLSALDEED